MIIIISIKNQQPQRETSSSLQRTFFLSLSLLREFNSCSLPTHSTRQDMYYYYYYYYSSGINTRTENNNNIIVYTTHNDWTKRNVLWFLFTLLSLTVFSSAKSISSIVPVAGSVSTIYRMDNNRRNNNCRGRCTFPCFVFSISAKQTSHPRFVMNIQSLFFYSSHLPRWDPVKHKFRAKNCINHPRTLYIVNYNNKPQTNQIPTGARSKEWNRKARNRGS